MSDAISILNPETREPEIPAGQPERPPLKPKAWYTNRIVKIMFLAATIVAAAGLTVFVCYYVKFARLTEQRLRAGVFAGTLNIFAGPRVISVGDRLSLNDALAYLRENGYSESRSNPVGSFGVQPNAVAIFPGRESYSDQEPAVIHFSAAASDNKVARIVSLADNTDRQEYQFPRQLLTNQSDRNREKRRLVRFSEIPPALVHAVVSVEDKHFFSHGGFDLFRILRAAFVDLKAGRKEQGASTLSMQLARILWLAPDKNWKRKAEELLITMHLEHKLTKQQIFEYYANQVYLGRLGTFSINGFGEAARAYFGKDISQLNLSEAAMLAGMVQRPSYYNPFRYPDRVQERRNRVLHLMVENRFLTDREYRGAVDTPVQVQTGDTEALNSQYFLDLVNDELQNRLGEHDPQRDYVYTTLDMDLQRAAVEAVRIGMQNVDEQLRRRKNPDPIPARPAAGGADRARSAFRRDQGAGGREGLRVEPVEPHCRGTSTWFRIQAVRVRRGAEYGDRRRRADFHSRDHHRGRAYDFPIRQSTIPAGQLQAGFHGNRYAAASAGALVERGHRETGADGGV